ncbi:MAG: hypothetical protein Q9210_001573 [Variospora velana]
MIVSSLRYNDARLTADVLLRLFQNTLLNPSITLPIYLLSLYTQTGQKLVSGHDIALSRVKLLVYAGILRWINNFLSNSAANNWNNSKYDWDKEVVVISGGSDGIGKSVALLLAEKGAGVAILDIQPLTFEPRTDSLSPQHSDRPSDHSCSAQYFLLQV